MSSAAQFPPLSTKTHTHMHAAACLVIICLPLTSQSCNPVILNFECTLSSHAEFLKNINVWASHQKTEWKSLGMRSRHKCVYKLPRRLWHPSKYENPSPNLLWNFLTVNPESLTVLSHCFIHKLLFHLSSVFNQGSQPVAWSCTLLKPAPCLS